MAMAQMVLISEWLAYHVWMTKPVCPNVRFVTVFLLLGTRGEALENESEQRDKSHGGAEFKSPISSKLLVWVLYQIREGGGCRVMFYDEKWPLAGRKTVVSQAGCSR